VVFCLCFFVREGFWGGVWGLLWGVFGGWGFLWLWGGLLWGSGWVFVLRGELGGGRFSFFGGGF